MRLDPSLERATSEPDEDLGPAVDRLEGRRVDDPRPAGDRLEAPRPLALEARPGHPQPERRFRAAPRGSRRAPSRAAGPAASARCGWWRPPARTGPRDPGAARGRAMSTRTGHGATPRPSVAWPARTPAARPAGRRAGGRRHAGSRPRGQDGRPSTSDADRVPDRLHLEEDGDPLGTLGGPVVEPVEARLVDGRRPARQALDVIGGELLGLEPERRRARPTCRARRRRRARPAPGPALPCGRSGCSRRRPARRRSRAPRSG